MSGGAGGGATQTVIVGDCREVMRGMEANSVDAICTDPPYFLGFMNRGWDKASPKALDCDGLPGSRGHGRRPGESEAIARKNAMASQEWHRTWLVEALRVLKPGGVLMAFGGTRTWHRLACAIEDAGFVLFDTLMWLHGQGFPKHRTLLKPAWEPVIVAKKPGAGGLRTEAGRLALAADDGDMARVRAEGYASKHPGWQRPWMSDAEAVAARIGRKTEATERAAAAGRWPTNIAISHLPECVPVGVRRVKGSNPGLVAGSRQNGGGSFGGGFHEAGRADYADPDGRETVPAYRCAPGCPVAELDRQSGERASGGSVESWGSGSGETAPGWGMTSRTSPGYHDAGGASRFVKTCAWEPGEAAAAARFFYAAKADRGERRLPDGRRCSHPTQKPLSLISWLVALCAKPGDTILDPFLGSGTTLIAADRLGVNGVGIEQDPTYAAEAELRIRGDAPLFARVISG